jgi:hypothetical protein
MEWASAVALVRRLSTPAEREKCQRALDSLQSPRFHGDAEEPGSVLVDIARRAWMPRRADIAGLDAERASRLCRTIDVDERAKALFRMLRTRCRHSPDTPGKAVVTHPRVARGPNGRGPIQFADSPAGLVRT